MGTSATTRVLNKAGREFMCLWRHSDGHPSAHGRELAEFLSAIRIISPIFRDGDDREWLGRTAHNMGCLSAQIVAHFKRHPGYFYLQPASDEREGFDYAITANDYGKIHMTVTIYGVELPIFDGHPAEFDAANVQAKAEHAYANRER